MLATLALCVSALLAADPAEQTTKPQELDVLPIEQNIIDLTNLERKRCGLRPLDMDPALMKSARDHTAWMTRCQTLRHTTRPVAENIAMGQRSSREVVRSWMCSPGHRANILNRCHRRIGVAAYRSTRGTIFWCQQFCR